MDWGLCGRLGVRWVREWVGHLKLVEHAQFSRVGVDAEEVCEVGGEVGAGDGRVPAAQGLQ